MKNIWRIVITNYCELTKDSDNVYLDIHEIPRQTFRHNIAIVYGRLKKALFLSLFSNKTPQRIIIIKIFAYTMGYYWFRDRWIIFYTSLNLLLSYTFINNISLHWILSSTKQLCVILLCLLVHRSYYFLYQGKRGHYGSYLQLATIKIVIQI